MPLEMEEVTTSEECMLLKYGKSGGGYCQGPEVIPPGESEKAGPLVLAKPERKVKHLFLNLVSDAFLSQPSVSATTTQPLLYEKHP